MTRVDTLLTPTALVPKIDRMFALSAQKIRAIEETWNPAHGAPVFTVNGRYRARGWTQWTEGFQYGASLLQFDATGDEAFLDLGRSRTLARMPPHVTHMGVHDHGFNNVSTYGTLWRLAQEGRYSASEWEVRLYELALMVSGAVQAHRWTRLPNRLRQVGSLRGPTKQDSLAVRSANRRGGQEGGYIYSFNGAHSLFVDTMRSLRALALAHRLGQRLLEEQDASVSLLERLIQHAQATAEFNVWYGRGRDAYDIRGRVAHESMFNVASGTYRGPSTQQGYSPFTTWTRGLAWAMLGFAEQLEFLATLDAAELKSLGGRTSVEAWMLDAARATCDFYIDEAVAADGVPYWDTGAPGLVALGEWRGRASDPFNDHEPVDSSAAAIAAQGLLRLGRVLSQRGEDPARYEQAGLRTLATLLDEPYVSVDPDHQGLLLHSVYHRPNGWDEIPAGRRVPCGESTQWGDYHLREVALYVKRVAEGAPYLTFFGTPDGVTAGGGRV